MKNKILFLTIGVLGLALDTQADILELKNGTVLNGKYAGGTPATIRFETAAGQQAIETSQVVALTFTAAGAAGAAPTPAAAAAPAAAPAAAAPAQTATLPAGTTLLVRMMDSVSSKSPAGTKFTTKLEYDLPAGAAVVKGGTVIYGKVQSSTQARRATGQSTLDLRLAQMVINGQPVSITSSGYQQAGDASIKKAARGAAAGAAIGAIAGDAGKGAAIGATAGAVKKGETVTVPPGTLLEFTLTQPVSLTL